MNTSYDSYSKQFFATPARVTKPPNLPPRWNNFLLVCILHHVLCIEYYYSGMHISMHIMHDVCIVRRFSHVKIVCIVVNELVLYILYYAYYYYFMHTTS